MDILSFPNSWKWQVAFSVLLCSWGWVLGQLRYSIAEESDPGTVVGNIAQDLGLNLVDINRRRLSLESEGKGNIFAIDQKNGALIIKDRIDRESLCGSSLSCLLQLEVLAGNPLELFSLEIEVLDINDNSPFFSSINQVIKITEVASPGLRFQLELAKDLDVGKNGVRQYNLNSNPYFSLLIKNRKDGSLIAELVLDKSLDREVNAEHTLIFTAIDGGEQPRSGSTQISVVVLDINDNAPVFDHSSYKISVVENTPLKTVVIKLNATDLDEGTNSEILYSFDHHTLDSAKNIFDIDQYTGEVFVTGIINFEDSDFYELFIKAEDKGSPKLEGHCVIQVDVQDVNDNTPEIIYTSKNSYVPENAPVGTVVGFVTIRDRDSGKNGDVKLEISPDLPFKCQPMLNRYTLVTSGHLDREKVSRYTITLIASDLGSPSLSSQTTITITISDVNDNPPAFLQSAYNAFISENNEPGRLLCTVAAGDPDEGDNAILIYSIAESHIDGSPVSSFVYINSDTGNIYAQRSFDYEQLQVLQITARVEDSGSPKLFSNVTVFIFIQDTNDNYPSILYPENSGEVISQETITRYASAGYLVSKVSAVDLDSGHNAWLTYSLLQSGSPALFHISEYTGEVRTLRGLQEMDNTEHRLVISVSDHGEPSLSSTVTLIVNIMDNIAQESPKSHDFLTNSKSTPDMTLYLIISLVATTLVSVVTFIILIVRCLKRDSYSSGCGSCFPNKSHSSNYMDHYKPTLYLNTDGTLKYMEVRMAPTDPPGPCYPPCFPPSTNAADFTLTKPVTALHSVLMDTQVNQSTSASLLNEISQQAQPNADWRISQAQRPGPSGAQPTEEAGVWPNNQFETERLQAMILASANEAAEGTSGLGGSTGTMGLSARYGPQFTLQHVPDYRQNVYIPGSTLTPTNAAGKRDGKGGGNKKKSGKKDKK
ncbi:protocadherin gamma-C5-like isoform X10 [Rana temporaria]|uniref:protocadherin gamma-C5-like isoform X10 n=1 Tax=Rana temporaria TaxID=8407 RepID=UPI001AADBFD9|nr:protocadherin gamma-C5-like isoform X10 [Rana temporaria]